MIEPLRKAVKLTSDALDENPESQWIIGFSGGKDSTALLKVFSLAVKETENFSGIINIIYCDTGVENPVLDQYVKGLLNDLENEFIRGNAPFRVRLLNAPVEERFFVKVIGRGYPPPTNSFRWCTKYLRIKPVSKYISNAAMGDAIVSLGMRRSESVQRGRSVKRGGDGYWQEQIEGGKKYRLFLPILDFDVKDVWQSIASTDMPESINSDELKLLYQGASGECPLIRTPQSAPCASGRFGCWTCTVVRKDHSAINLIKAGHNDLEPFLDFRNWIVSIRNDPNRRWPNRRNGVASMGPFTLGAREEIYSRIRKLENLVGETIISPEEQLEISRLWELDKNNENELQA